MNFDKVEEHIKLQQKKRFTLLKADTSMNETIEENKKKQYRIRPIKEGGFLFYHDKKNDRALMVQIELNHLMDRSIFTHCLPKKWDTGKKTSNKQRNKVVKRIEAYYKKFFNKEIFQE